MKVNKYKTDTSKKSLESKLLSYGSMAAAFIMAGGQANAQCGTADAANPILAVDIDGDGTTDVNLNFQGANNFTTSSTTQTPVATSTNLFNTQIGTLSTYFYVGGNFSYYGCQPAAVPAYYGGGYAGGSFFNGDPAWGSFTNVTATAPIYSQVNALNVFSYSFNFFAVNYNFAFASANGSNQIVGLSAAGSSVCNAIDAAPGVAGPNSASLGVNGSFFTYYFNVLAASSIQYLYTGSASIAVPTVTCMTNTYSVYGVYLPPIPATFATAVNSSSVYVGPFAIGSSSAATFTTIFQNTSTTTHLAVQFISGGETHNGWIELSIDPNTSEITCVNTGYNACSIETAIANTSNALLACIETGEATIDESVCVVCEPVQPVFIPNQRTNKKKE